MPENFNEIYNNIIVILCVLCIFFLLFKLFYRRIRDSLSPVKNVKAQVVDKFVADNFSKIYGSAAKKPRYFVVFAIGEKKRSFAVSAFSYNGYRLNEKGTLKYKGSRLIDFH